MGMRYEKSLISHGKKEIEEETIQPFNDITVANKHHPYERSRVMIIGPSMSGKTNLLFSQFLANNDKDPFMYTQVFIFGTAIVDDPLYSYLLRKDVKKQFTTPIVFSDNLIEFNEIIKSIKTVPHGTPGPLMIIDDMTAFLKQNKDMNNFVTMARHKGCTMVFSVHKFNKMDKMAREQMNIIFVTKMNQGEANVICKEVCGYDYYADIRNLKKYQWLRIVDGMPNKIFKPES